MHPVAASQPNSNSTISSRPADGGDMRALVSQPEVADLVVVVDLRDGLVRIAVADDGRAA